MQDQLLRLEGAGVLISRTLGRARLFEFNPRNPTVTRLRAFLAEGLGSLAESLIKQRFPERQRPRRAAKPLERGVSLTICRPLARIRNAA
jgi:hypothetical protein